MNYLFVIYYNITCMLATHMIPSSLDAASKAIGIPWWSGNQGFLHGTLKVADPPVNATPEPQEIRSYTPEINIFPEKCWLED